MSTDSPQHTIISGYLILMPKTLALT